MPEPNPCSICGHDFNLHPVAGRIDIGVSAFLGLDVPVAGAITCQEPDCDCWATWCIKEEGMEPGLLALIEQELAWVKEEHIEFR